MTDVEMNLGGSASPQKHQATVEEDLYMKMKDLESQLEILQIHEDYLKDE
jgi:hypothetical protein